MKQVCELAQDKAMIKISIRILAEHCPDYVEAVFNGIIQTEREANDPKIIPDFLNTPNLNIWEFTDL